MKGNGSVKGKQLPFLVSRFCAAIFPCTHFHFHLTMNKLGSKGGHSRTQTKSHLKSWIGLQT